MEKKVSPTSTKTEILKAYNELLNKIQESKQDNPKAENAESNTKEITLKAIQSSGQIKIVEKEDNRRKSEE